MRIIFKPVHIKIKIIRWRVCGGNRSCNSKRWKESIVFTPRSLYIHFARQNGTKLLSEMKSLKDRIIGLIKVTV